MVLEKSIWCCKVSCSEISCSSVCDILEPVVIPSNMFVLYYRFKMEEQDKILQRLVKQRHLRPSYNRAISKELSKVSDEQQTSSKLHSHREAEPSSIQQVEHDPDQCDEDVFESECFFVGVKLRFNI